MAEIPDWSGHSGIGVVLRGQLGEERFEVFAAEGRAMPVEQALEYAMQEEEELARFRIEADRDGTKEIPSPGWRR